MRQFFRSGVISRNAGDVEAPIDERDLLNASTDFTVDGSYVMAEYLVFNGEEVFGTGLTHRYVSGNLRLMALGYNGGGGATNYDIIEFALPGSFGSNITNLTSHSDPFNGREMGGSWHSIFWDTVDEKVWTSSAIDYGFIDYTSCMMARTIGTTSGACSSYEGFWGFQNVGARALFGNIRNTPTWAKTAYGFRDKIALSGGYTSLVAQGLTPSMGPFFMTFDDPLGDVAGVDRDAAYNVPTTSFDILGDLRSGAIQEDWYDGSYATRDRERGVRTTAVQNYFDSNVSQPGRPTGDPDAGANWTSPAPSDPDGWGRWVWGDTYSNGGNWIDNDAGTRTKHGIVMIASVANGKAWYSASAVQADARNMEIHVFDPADLYAVKQGSLDAWKIRPKTVFSLASAIGSDASCNGSTYDTTNNKLYIRTQEPAINPTLNRIVQISVGGA